MHVWRLEEKDTQIIPDYVKTIPAKFNSFSTFFLGGDSSFGLPGGSHGKVPLHPHRATKPSGRSTQGLTLIPNKAFLFANQHVLHPDAKAGASCMSGG
jgi:hypothetical protein